MVVFHGISVLVTGMTRATGTFLSPGIATVFLCHDGPEVSTGNVEPMEFTIMEDIWDYRVPSGNDYSILRT